jgi:hypothetical protein
MFPCPQRLPRLYIQRNVFQRSFRFRRTLHHRHYRPKDLLDEVFEIHVLPPKPDPAGFLWIFRSRIFVGKEFPVTDRN